MTKKTGPGRRWFVAGIIILILVAVGIGGWNYFKYRLIKHKVSNLLYKNTNGLYTVEYDSLSVDEVAGNLSVTHLRLIPDTAKYRELYDNHQNAPSLLVAVTIPLLRISGVKTPRAVLNREIEGGRIAISNADIVIYHARSRSDSALKDTTKNPSLQETLLQLLNNLHHIKADTVQVDNTSLSYVDFIDDEQRVKGAAFSVHLYDILIDSASVADTGRILFARQVDANLHQLVINDKKGFYHYTADTIGFSSAGHSLVIKDFRVVPLHGEDGMMKASGTQTDRFDFHCGELSFKHLDLPQLMQGVIDADTLLITRGRFNIYRDLSYPRAGKSMIGRFPHQSLMKLAVPYRLQKVVATDAFIEYKERNPRSDSAGRVQFYHSTVVISRLTNIDSLLKKDNNCTVNFDTKLLNMSSLTSRIVLQLKDTAGRFTVKASVSGFDATRLNTLLRPMALAQADKGQIKRLDFELEGNNYTSHGKLVFLYEGLKVSVLKKDEQEKKLKEKKLVSMIANLVVKDANPGKKDKGPREATIDYKRITDRSFFNLIWKSVLQGVKISLGVEK